jgi:hypothetical protein
MERLKKAGELMIPLEKYPHVPYWFSLRQAVAVLENTTLHPDVSGGPSLARFVLVFDQAYKLLGITRKMLTNRINKYHIKPQKNR